MVIVHRVVAVVDDDPLTLRTKGDNNQNSIVGTDYPITEEEYKGTVIHVIPQVGYITKILQPPINYIIIAVIIGIMIIRQISKNKKVLTEQMKTESEIDFEKIGLKVGLEINQQLNTNKKLFCKCRSIESDEYTEKFSRSLRTAKSELGKLDPAALFEKTKSKKIN